MTTASQNAASDLMREIEAILIDATRDVFVNSGVQLAGAEVGAEAPLFGDDPVAASVLGYAGERIRGALVLLAATDAVARWVEADAVEPSYDSVADTIGEFSNLVLGRLKHDLLLRGVTIMLATPTTSTGVGIQFPSGGGEASSWIRFEAPTGRFYVRLDATFDPGLSLQTATGEAPAASGESLLF